MEFHDNGMNDFMTREQLERQVSGNADNRDEVRLQE